MRRFIMATVLATLMVFGFSTGANAQNDTDWGGIGNTTMPSFFSNTDWYKTSDNTVCKTGWEQCDYLYNNYKMNCLSEDTPGPAIQVVWARPEGQTIANTWYEAHRPEFRSQMRAAVSAYAASMHAGWNATDMTRKDDDRTPRIITEQTSSGCAPKVLHVAVPHNVLLRIPIQNKYGTDTTKQGVLPYLESIGYNQPNRRYIVFMDYTSYPASELQDSWVLIDSAGPTSMAAIDMQRQGLLWGPYGTGQRSDVDTQPGPENFCNRGGTVAYFSVFGNAFSDLPRIGPSNWTWDDTSDNMAWGIAHELGHTFCLNYLAPHYGGQGHVTDGKDIMGDTAGTDCTPEWRASRFDCNSDDYWGTNGVYGQQAWASQRWSASNNEYLWGAPKSSSQNEWFSLNAVNIDCANLVETRYAETHACQW